MSARAALERDIGPHPIERDDDAVAEADQEIDVHDAPDEPGEPAAQAQPAEIHHRGLAPDRSRDCRRSR